jgi:hypothetical protein
MSGAILGNLRGLFPGLRHGTVQLCRHRRHASLQVHQLLLARRQRRVALGQLLLLPRPRLR